MLNFELDLSDGATLSHPQIEVEQYRPFRCANGFQDVDGFVYRTNALRYSYAGKESRLSDGHFHRDDRGFAARHAALGHAHHLTDLIEFIGAIERRGRIPRVLYFHPSLRASRLFQLGDLRDSANFSVNDDRSVVPESATSDVVLRDLFDRLHPITRVKVSDLPEGAAFPDPWPQHHAFGIVHIMAGTSADLVTVSPSKIEVWVNGGWHPLAGFPHGTMDRLVNVQDVSAFVPDLADLMIEPARDDASWTRS